MDIKEQPAWKAQLFGGMLDVKYDWRVSSGDGPLASCWWWLAFMVIFTLTLKKS